METDEIRECSEAGLKMKRPSTGSEKEYHATENDKVPGRFVSKVRY